MGQQQFGSALSTKNEKKSVTFRQEVVKTSPNMILDIQVVFGNSICPQLWNKAIIETRRTDIDLPLNIRRFFDEPQEQAQQQDAQDNNQNQVHQNENNEQDNQFHFEIRNNTRTPFDSVKGEFAILKVPDYVGEELQNQSINQSMSDSIVNTNQRKNICFVYTEEKDQEYNYYRQEYIKAYIKIFKKLQEDYPNYISIAILDMPQDNPILGIDNYQMTSDILEALLNCEPKFNRLIFTSENYLQAVIMAQALSDKKQINQQFNGNNLNQDELEIEIDNNSEKKMKLIQNEEVINLKEQQEQSIQEIQLAPQFVNRQLVSSSSGHFLNATFSYSRDLRKPLDTQVLETIVPVLDRNNNQQCICGRKTTFRLKGNKCCYCCKLKSTFWTCEQRACGRNYCASCLSPQLFYNKCYKGHKLTYAEIENNLQKLCEYCHIRHQIIWECIQCQFVVCNKCYYINYEKWLFEKMKFYQLLLQAIKPNLKKQVQFDLILNYLLDSDFKYKEQLNL